MQLQEIADRLSVKVLIEDLAKTGEAARSGGCCYRGSNYIILDRRLDAEERTRILARELARFDLEGIYLPPALRRLIEVGRNERGDRS